MSSSFLHLVNSLPHNISPSMATMFIIHMSPSHTKPNPLSTIFSYNKLPMSILQILHSSGPWVQQFKCFPNIHIVRSPPFSAPHHPQPEGLPNSRYTKPKLALVEVSSNSPSPPQQGSTQGHHGPSHLDNETQLNYLMASFRVGMLALETLSRRVHDDRPQTKYARNPPYGEDVKWLLGIAVKLGKGKNVCPSKHLC